jgi:hypothetical protein
MDHVDSVESRARMEMAYCVGDVEELSIRNAQIQEPEELTGIAQVAEKLGGMVQLLMTLLWTQKCKDTS